MLHYAVITGDLIGSTTAPERLEATLDRIAATAAFLTTFTGEDTRFTRFRGDGWQIILAPHYYLRAIALILAELKTERRALSTRFGIGIGPVETTGTIDLRDATGDAFIQSGHALDSLTRDHTTRLAATLAAGLGPTERAERLRGAVEWSDAALLPMLAFIARRWTPAQAEAMALALKNDRQTQASIAAQLGITRQALNTRLTGAGYGPVLTAIKLTEQYFADFGTDGGPGP
jgi:hypothetical protein